MRSRAWISARAFGTVDVVVRTLSSVGRLRACQAREVVQNIFGRCKRIEDLPTKTGGNVGHLPSSIDIGARSRQDLRCDYKTGPRGKRVRQANLSIDIGRRAWKIVRRLYPKVVRTENPFEGVLKIRSNQDKDRGHPRRSICASARAEGDRRTSSRGRSADLFRVAAASRERADRKITWPDYRAAEHPNHVRIFHHKTGQVVLQPLEDEGRKLYPELETYSG